MGLMWLMDGDGKWCEGGVLVNFSERGCGVFVISVFFFFSLR